MVEVTRFATYRYTPVKVAEFWSQVDASGDCWLWTGKLNGAGYGVFQSFGFSIGPHRAVWEMLCGTIPDGLEIDHRCFNVRCVNPDHLEPVSQAVNLARRRAPGRRDYSVAFCKNGHQFTPANTYRVPTGRMCKACNREAQQRWRDRKKASAANC